MFESRKLYQPQTLVYQKAFSKAPHWVTSYTATKEELYSSVYVQQCGREKGTAKQHLMVNKISFTDIDVAPWDNTDCLDTKE